MPSGNSKAKTRSALRECEKLGVLTRTIVPHAVPLDGESIRKIFPPRLFFLPRFGILAHALGDDAFYELNPEFERGGLSKEIYILDKAPMHLSNYFAMEGLYSKVEGLQANDALRGRKV